MDPDELRERTKRFALDIIRLAEALPKSIEGRVIGTQLVKAGTSVAANYRAACRARSKREFIAKLGVVIEEADESAFWLELIEEAGLLEAARTRPLHKEAEELTRIMTTSRQTARRNG